MKPPATSAPNQQRITTPVGYPQSHPQTPQNPFTSQEQPILQNTVPVMNQPRPQANPDFSQNFNQPPTSGPEPLPPKEQSIPQNPSPLLSQPTPPRPLVNPNFPQIPQNNGMFLV